MTNTEKYWSEFERTQEALVAEWRENYDPDGELSTLELIERVMAREPEKQLAGIYNALGDSVFDLSDEDVREEMQSDGFDDRAAGEMRARLLRAVPDDVRAERDAICDHTWITRHSVSGDGYVRLCSTCGEIHSADISARDLTRLLPEGV